jgi:hypothetical protein
MNIGITCRGGLHPPFDMVPVMLDRQSQSIDWADAIRPYEIRIITLGRITRCSDS